MAYQTHRNWVRKDCICVCKHLDHHDQRFQSDKTTKTRKLSSPRRANGAINNLPGESTLCFEHEQEDVISNKADLAFIGLGDTPRDTSDISNCVFHTKQTASTESVFSLTSSETSASADYTTDWPEDYFQNFESFTFDMSQSQPTQATPMVQTVQNFNRTDGSVTNTKDLNSIPFSRCNMCIASPIQRSRRISDRSSSLSSGASTSAPTPTHTPRTTTTTSAPSRLSAATRSERRRQQNRQAQQAFRQRKHAKLLQLEGEVQALRTKLEGLKGQSQDESSGRICQSVEGGGQDETLFTGELGAQPGDDARAVGSEPFIEWWPDTMAPFGGDSWA